MPLCHKIPPGCVFVILYPLFPVNFAEHLCSLIKFEKIIEAMLFDTLSKSKSRGSDLLLSILQHVCIYWQKKLFVLLL